MITDISFLRCSIVQLIYIYVYIKKKKQNPQGYNLSSYEQFWIIIIKPSKLFYFSHTVCIIHKYQLHSVNNYWYMDLGMIVILSCTYSNANFPNFIFTWFVSKSLRRCLKRCLPDVRNTWIIYNTNILLRKPHFSSPFLCADIRVYSVTRHMSQA